MADNALGQQYFDGYPAPAMPYAGQYQDAYPSTPGLSGNQPVAQYPSVAQYPHTQYPAPAVQSIQSTAPPIAPLTASPAAPNYGANFAPPLTPPAAPAVAPTLPRPASEPITLPTEQTPAPQLPAPEESMIVEEAPTAWYYQPLYWFDLWEGGVEVGLNGTEGNTQTLDYLIGLDVKRKTDTDIFDFDIRYDRKTSNSVESAHRMFSDLRWDLLFGESPWTWFIHQTTEYDEFKAFDVRLSYDTGLGQSLIKTDATSLLARAGVGLSHKLGGADEDPVPEAVFGLEFERQLNERQKFSASTDYTPDMTVFEDYRLNIKAAWEVLLDEETNLSLRVSVLDRYDSTPNGAKANDLDYSLTLLWNF